MKKIKINIYNYKNKRKKKSISTFLTTWILKKKLDFEKRNKALAKLFLYGTVREKTCCKCCQSKVNVNSRKGNGRDHKRRDHLFPAINDNEEDEKDNEVNYRHYSNMCIVFILC